MVKQSLVLDKNLITNYDKLTGLLFFSESDCLQLQYRSHLGQCMRMSNSINHHDTINKTSMYMYTKSVRIKRIRRDYYQQLFNSCYIHIGLHDCIQHDDVQDEYRLSSDPQMTEVSPGANMILDEI